MGITNAWELRNMSAQWAYKNLGRCSGSEVNKGIARRTVHRHERPAVMKKMIATTRMFGNPVSCISDIKEAVATYTSRAAEKLRRQRSAANTVHVFIVPKEQHYADDFHHGPTSGTYTVLPAATSITHELIKPAVHLVDRLFEEGKSYKKAGVRASGLVADTAIQGNLFMPPR